MAVCNQCHSKQRTGSFFLTADSVICMLSHIRKERALERCHRENVTGEKCREIFQSVRRILLIAPVVEREIVPKIKVTDEEIERLLNAHAGEEKEKRKKKNR